MSSASDDNLLKGFEDAYQATVDAITQEDLVFDRSSETLHQQLEDRITKFTDIGRKLEHYFLQKRFLFHSIKPELILREDSTELRQELAKKDELIRKHYEKLGQWQILLREMHGVPGGGGGQQQPAVLRSATDNDETTNSTVQSNQATQPSQVPAVNSMISQMPGLLPGNNYRIRMSTSGDQATPQFGSFMSPKHTSQY